MWIDLPNVWIILLNVLGIPSVHILSSVITTRLSVRWFESPQRTRLNHLELQLHTHVFHTKRWKHHLPDAAPWMGGFPKAHLLSKERAYLDRFMCEARRGEVSHWIQLMAILCFVAWNPWPASGVIVAYALLSNLPCILNLRFTRMRLARTLTRTSKVDR